MAKILETRPASIESIVAAFQKNSQSVFGQILSYLDSGPLYRDVVIQVAKELKVWCGHHDTAAEIEVRIARKVFQTTWEKMTPAQRQKMEEGIEEDGPKV